MVKHRHICPLHRPSSAFKARLHRQFDARTRRIRDRFLCTNRNRRTSAEVRKADKSPMLRAMRYYHRRELHTDYLLINTGMATMFQHQHRFSPCA